MNLAEHAEAMAAGQHPGYDPYAWDGIEQSIDAISAKRIKVIINGGALNPRGLAIRTQELVWLIFLLYVNCIPFSSFLLFSSFFSFRNEGKTLRFPHLFPSWQ